ncbi:MAG: EAL domain-containing protein [Eubacteriales bacterium]|nr:EAL domain-containing protein [Eubacteriales bacterium]
MGKQLNSTSDSDLQELLYQVVRYQDIRPVFQPIVSLRDGTLLGYEALSRGPAGTPLENPEALFHVAQQCNLLWNLEMVCHAKALRAIQGQSQNIKWFFKCQPHCDSGLKIQRRLYQRPAGPVQHCAGNHCF